MDVESCVTNEYEDIGEEKVCQVFEDIASDEFGTGFLTISKDQWIGSVRKSELSANALTTYANVLNEDLMIAIETDFENREFNIEVTRETYEVYSKDFAFGLAPDYAMTQSRNETTTWYQDEDLTIPLLEVTFTLDDYGYELANLTAQVKDLTHSEQNVVLDYTFSAIANGGFAIDTVIIYETESGRKLGHV